MFELSSRFEPQGDQPQAIEKLAQGIKDGLRDQVLLGVTGSGKTFTMANIIRAAQRPALVIAHNKTLAAQLAGEFREFFPDNAVGYFVSYYDYYQPEAYIPSTDTFIEKDSAVNDEIDRMRHSATAWLARAARRDHRGLGKLHIRPGRPRGIRGAVHIAARGRWQFDRDALLRSAGRHTVRPQRLRVQARGSFRVRGDVVEIIPADSGKDRRARGVFRRRDRAHMRRWTSVTGHVLRHLKHAMIFPASHYATSREKLERQHRDDRT